MVGNFKINVKQKNEISDELIGIFQRGIKGFYGASRELMLYLGEQLVNGTNYAYITRCTPATLNPIPYYELMIINVDTDGKASIASRETIIESSQIGTVGGIICSSSYEAAIQENKSAESKHLLDLFDKGVSDFDYKAELYLGHKIVQGCKYYYLAEAKDKKGENSIKLVVIYSFMKKIEISGIEDIL
ncbi:hypothetical protein [uncultured Brachyspira sp.]|uniref:hypothetical protein n=1 Tax=uncultured Brachyspira sp. TaxID=221953 RepID=UPI00260C38EC|nr:hypothetical protein [uncultured Brachyspira sp.]